MSELEKLLTLPGYKGIHFFPSFFYDFIFYTMSLNLNLFLCAM